MKHRSDGGHTSPPHDHASMTTSKHGRERVNMGKTHA